MLTAKKLIVTATTSDSDTNDYFEAWEFQNGLCLVPSESCSDSFFINKEAIEPNGFHEAVAFIEETTETTSWKAIDLAQALAKSTLEFQYDDSIRKGWELLKNH